MVDKMDIFLRDVNITQWMKDCGILNKSGGLFRSYTKQDYFENHPNKFFPSFETFIPQFGLFYEKEDPVIWDSSKVSFIQTLRGKKILKINYCKKFNIEECRRFSIESLMSIVDEELTLGDKLLVRNIAMTSFDHSFNMVVNNSKNSDGITLARCICTKYHTYCIEKLLEYGFKLNQIDYN